MSNFDTRALLDKIVEKFGDLPFANLENLVIKSYSQNVTSASGTSVVVSFDGFTATPIAWPMLEPASGEPAIAAWIENGDTLISQTTVTLGATVAAGQTYVLKVLALQL